jgi:hypothetical protein
MSVYGCELESSTYVTVSGGGRKAPIVAAVSVRLNPVGAEQFSAPEVIVLPVFSFGKGGTI